MPHIKRSEDFFLQKIREGILEIDERGNVYKVFDERRGKEVYKRIEYPSPNGYVRVQYRKGAEQHYCFVHRLVYAYFYGIPDGMVINHKDGQKWNNCISNLEAVTPKQNVQHAIHVLGVRNFQGARNPRAKLTPHDVERIFELRSQGYTFQKIAAEFKISNKQVMNIIKGKQWKNRGEDPEHPALPSPPRKIRIPC